MEHFHGHRDHEDSMGMKASDSTWLDNPYENDMSFPEGMKFHYRRFVRGAGDVTLKSQINSCLKRSAFNERQFLPQGCLEKLQRPEIIKYELERAEVQCSDLDDLTTWILENAMRTFLILVKLRWTSRILSFRSVGFVDSKLPIFACRRLDFPYTSVATRDDMWDATRSDGLNSSDSSDDEVGDDLEGSVNPLSVFNSEPWIRDDSDLMDFADWQWSFIAPVLRRDEFAQYGTPLTILPIVKVRGTAKGGFSTILKVMIHRTHIVPALAHGQFIAVKQFKGDQEEITNMFRTERHVLEVMRDMQHPHLIEFIAGFAVGFKLSLIFPWTDGGNLREYWFEDQEERNGTECLRWIIAQLIGLFDGLQALHSKDCLHGDIKPENLLLFPQDGAWPRIVLADFGLARANSVSTTVRKASNQHTKNNLRSPMYEAPESEDAESEERFAPTSSHDIWQMGCVSLEFLIWFLWGSFQGLESFNNLLAWGPLWKVTSDSQEKTGLSRKKVVHPAVLSTVGWLSGRDVLCGKDTATGDILALIMEKLLVIETYCDVGRAEAANVLESMKSIQQKALPESVYLRRCILKDGASDGDSLSNAHSDQALLPHRPASFLQEDEQ